MLLLIFGNVILQNCTRLKVWCLAPYILCCTKSCIREHSLLMRIFWQVSWISCYASVELSICGKLNYENNKKSLWMVQRIFFSSFLTHELSSERSSSFGFGYHITKKSLFVFFKMERAACSVVFDNPNLVWKIVWKKILIINKIPQFSSPKNKFVFNKF